MNKVPPPLHLVIQNWNNAPKPQRLGQYFINQYMSPDELNDFSDLYEAPYVEAVDMLKNIYHAYQWEI